MELYEWMVKPTPQREWIDRRGILLWLAFFFIELGAGTFFVASFFFGSPNMLIAVLIGWLVCGILGGGTHLLYLGHPFRLWRMVLRPNASWISRGLIFVGLFLFFGLVQMVLARWASPSIALLIVTNILAFLVIIYGGFAMNYVNGVRLWNTALLPILYVVSGVWGGAGIALSTALATGTTIVGVTLEEWIRILLISYIVLLTVYLTSIGYGSTTGQYSVREIVASDVAGGGGSWSGVTNRGGCHQLCHRSGKSAGGGLVSFYLLRAYRRYGNALSDTEVWFL